MYVASQKRIRHEAIYYDTAHEAICLGALRRYGLHASKATEPSDTITDRDGIPCWLPDLRAAVPAWVKMPEGSPMTAYIECKEWTRRFGDPVPNEVADKLRRTAAFGAVTLIVLPRSPMVSNGMAWWGWLSTPDKHPVWKDLIFPSTRIMDAFAEASQSVVSPRQRFRRWESRHQLKLPLRRRDHAPMVDQNRRLPFRS